jgi:uncharacterized protein YdeI (YjbR/CyaY-like superfamily)
MTGSANRARADATDQPIRLFPTQKAWETWLRRNHDSASGLWLRLGKKSSTVKSVSYAEALDVALSYGWIDGQKRSYDESSWLQRFVPRARRSLWSRINREKAEALMGSGKMQPAGLAAVELARQDGRWLAAYDSPSRATVPADFKTVLDQHPKAKAFFAKLDRANRYAILFRIQTVKQPETRARRIQHFIGMLERGETVHP